MLIDPTRSTVVAWYDPLPDGLAQLVGRVQARAAGFLGAAFTPRDPAQVHATVIGLERAPAPFDPGPVAAHLRTVLEAPLTIQFGGFAPSEERLRSRGRPLHERGFLVRDGRAVLMGWPVEDDVPCRALADVRQGCGALGVTHRYGVDPDVYLVIGDVTGTPNAGPLQTAVRADLAAAATRVPLAVTDLCLVRYDDPALPGVDILDTARRLLNPTVRYLDLLPALSLPERPLGGSGISQGTHVQIVVVGAGPTGLFTGMALARRGHAVTVVDRDPGPAADGSWTRRGVMQFHHPHAFRAQVAEALGAELPQVWDDLLAAGAEPVEVPAGPDGRPQLVAVRCRRLTFERVLRAAAAREPGLVLRTGHVDDVLHERGRVTGVRVDGATLDADLVVAASGRAGRLGRDLRAAPQGGDCGLAYVSRQYRLPPGAAPGPMNFPLGQTDLHPGYQAIVFLHDSGVFSTLIARSSDDRELAALREPAAFDAAVRAVPALAAWTDPARSHPFTPVLPGGRLHNTYQGQLDENGAVPLPGLVFVGDAVCTTNPSVGRGVTTSLLQARALVHLLDHGGDDLADLARAFDRWCRDNIAPWFDDHVRWDADLARRWAGGDVDLTRPLPSDLVVAAAAADPALFPRIAPYLGMRVLPAALDAVQPRVREIYASGWRPPVPPGPSRDELAELVGASVGSALAATARRT